MGHPGPQRAQLGRGRQRQQPALLAQPVGPGDGPLQLLDQHAELARHGHLDVDELEVVVPCLLGGPATGEPGVRRRDQESLDLLGDGGRLAVVLVDPQQLQLADQLVEVAVLPQAQRDRALHQADERPAGRQLAVRGSGVRLGALRVERGVRRSAVHQVGPHPLATRGLVDAPASGQHGDDGQPTARRVELVPVEVVAGECPRQHGLDPHGPVVLDRDAYAGGGVAGPLERHVHELRARVQRGVARQLARHQLGGVDQPGLAPRGQAVRHEPARGRDAGGVGGQPHLQPARRTLHGSET